MQIVFDANGTLFGLDPVERLLGPLATEAFFERTLHSAATLTFAGAWAPFDEVARRALATTCAKLELDVDQQAVLDALHELPAAPDAHEAVELAGDCAILTNGSREVTEELVRRAGLPISEIRTCEEVRAYKPSAAPYGLVAGGVLVAGHAWDVAGARAAGLRAIWVDRSEREWPLAGVEPGERAAGLVEGVALARG